MTSNFKEEIGKGGFGTVFLGYLEDGTPVAVKMCSKTSSEGDKEFLAEVTYQVVQLKFIFLRVPGINNCPCSIFQAQHLTRVHHRNLVSLIGYCKDKKHLALVYENMQGGNLEDRLRGKLFGNILFHPLLNFSFKHYSLPNIVSTFVCC